MSSQYKVCSLFWEHCDGHYRLKTRGGLKSC